MKKLVSLFIVTVAMIGSGQALAGAHNGGGGPKAVGDGHCNYIQENMFAGPFAVCQMPTDAAYCEELGNTDDNADAVQGDGECSMDSSVGMCDMGEVKLVYYEGDAGGLEIGCGFQGGEWITTE